MKNKKLRHTHRTNILTFFARIPAFIYLLPIPILQNILFNPSGFWEHITSYVLSIIMFFAVGGAAAADYRTKRYRIFPERTYIRKGIFFRSRFNIPYDRLQSVIIQSSPFTALFSAVKVQLNTPATKAKKGDADFYLSKTNAKQLIGEIYDDIGFIRRHYRAGNAKIFFMAAIWSNPVSGLLIISPFINNTGKVVGEELQNQLIESFDLSKYLVYIGVPPTAAFIAYILIFCYAVSVCADFVRNANFTCTSYQNGLVIKRGIIKHTLFFTNRTKLNAITLNQSIFMMPFRLHSAYIYTVGSGKAKGDRSLLIAAEKKNSVKHLLSLLFEDLDLNFPFTIKPVRKALGAYLRLPVFLLTVEMALCLSLLKLNIFRSITAAFMFFSVPTLIVWCFFRANAFSKSALSLNDRYVYLRSYRRITLKSTIIPIGKIQLCVKRVNFFQSRTKTCNIKIYIYGEKRTFVEIKHLSESDADKFINCINN